MGSPPEEFPGHDGGEWCPAFAEIVASWPAGAFAENLAVDTAGGVFVSLHSHRRVDRYDPLTGRCEPWAEFPVPVAGLSFDTHGVLWVTGGVVGKNPGHVFRVTGDGQIHPWTTVPDALFMNGCTPLGDGRTLLVCESLTGRVLAVDQQEPAWRPWLTSRLLRPADPQTPGANGVKVSGGFAYLSVTDANTIYRVSIGPDGSPGELHTFTTHIRADDFAFAASGALFVATHPAQTVVRIGPDGQRSTIAGPAEGAVGSTACAFGRTPADRTSLYVTTNGGIYRPHEGVLQDAKLVRLDVGEPGPVAAGPLIETPHAQSMLSRLQGEG